MQKFELKQVTEIAPGCGEDLGSALARFAESEEQRCRALPNGKVSYWGSVVEQTLYLAAEAFEAGASASIGHNRAARYEERARALRSGASALAAEMKRERDDEMSASMLAAFDDGYAGRDIERHSFEKREAALLGQLFAKEGRETPKRLLKVYAQRPLTRDSERDHLLDDLGQKFVVDYPGGIIADAIVTQIA